MNHAASSSSSSSSPLVHGVTLTFLMLLLLNVAVVVQTDLIEDNCSLVQCPQIPDCPADSLLHTSSDEVVDDFDANYDEELPTSNRFEGVPIEELGPIQHSTEQPKLLVTTATTTTTTPLVIEPLERRKKRELHFTQSEVLGEEELEVENPGKNCCNTFQCVCQPCPEVPKCIESYHVAVEIRNGNGQPGNCCSTYECVPKQQCSTPGGANQIYWRDGCTKCSCFGSAEEELCQNQCQQDEPLKEIIPLEQPDEELELHKSCYSEYLQKPMLHGEFWLEDSDCSECSCTNGERSCFTNLCAAVECKNPVKVQGKCCPVCEEKEPVEKIVEISTTEEVNKNVKNTTESTLLTETTEIPESSQNFENSTVATATESTADSKKVIVTSTSTTSEEESTMSNNLTTSLPTYNESSTSFHVSSVSDVESSSTLVDSSTANISLESFDSTTTNLDLNSTTVSNSPTQTVSTENGQTLDITNSTPVATVSTPDLIEHTPPVTVSQILAETTISTTPSTTVSTEKPATTSSPLLGDILSSTNFVLFSSTSSPFTSTVTEAPSLPTDSSTYSTTASKSSTTSPIVSSTTSAPPPLEPQPTVYRQNDPALISPTLENDYNMVSTQQQMRDMFAEIDSVIIIALLLGFLLSIGLCLVLGVTYYNKEKKKAQKRLYSAVPNSETSLSQTSTNTMLTV